MSFISLDNISFSYSDIESGQPYKNAVDGVSLNIEKGEFVALLGHNGCGKSTVAKHLNAMLLPDKGKVYVDGDDTSDENKTYDIREKVGLVLQNPDNQLVASVVEEDVAFGPENLGIPPKEIRQSVDLPEPVCPIMPINSPFSIERLKLLTAVFSNGVPVP